jgi:capsular polysaccharide biosynthesis protein
MTWTFFIPDKYASFARYEIVFQQESNGVNSMTNPFRIQEQYEYLKSPTVLHQVIKDLDLSQTYSRQKNINPPLSMDATYQHLLKNMKLQQTRGTTLFEIWVYDEDKALAAMTANQIIEVYKNKKPASIASVSIIDKARPKLNPASPNRPLMLMVGCACSLLVSIILGKIVSLRCQKSTSL